MDILFTKSMRFVSFLCILLLFIARIAPGLYTIDSMKTLTDAELHVLKVEPLSRLKELAGISDSPLYLQRTFLSKGAIEAGKLIREWMQDAGMTTWIDDIGNVHGRVNGGNASAPALLFGSHLDTVIDAGMYDGSLGIITAIAAVKTLKIKGKLDSFPRPIEVIAFSDEEGVRFQSTFLGSAAVVGEFPEYLLSIVDKSGITLENALKFATFPGSIRSVKDIKYDRDDVWGYIELHIEQGPVLERQGIALGIVGSIAGQTRLLVKLTGSQGHAGTVPMAMRRDPMAAAAVAIVGIEHTCKHPEEFLFMRSEGNQRDGHFMFEGALLCTVGEIAAWPGASNVIPGEVTFSVDIRAENDDVRTKAVDTIRNQIKEMCEDRQISFKISVKHEAKAVHCHPNIQELLNTAATKSLHNLPASGLHLNRQFLPTLVSGAGHDAAMMAHLTKVGMLFVRCTGGVSHSPNEHVQDDDIWAASLALKAFLDNEITSTDIPSFNPHLDGM